MSKSDINESAGFKSKSDNACCILLTIVILVNLVILVICSAFRVFFYGSSDFSAFYDFGVPF